jgi:hypothetical protein
MQKRICLPFGCVKLVSLPEPEDSHHFPPKISPREAALMESTYQHIESSIDRGVFCVRLKHPRLEEHEVQEFGEELESLIKDCGCRKMVVSLGPNMPNVLYSVFLAKLVMIHRLLVEQEGAMQLCDVNEDVMGVFKACQLDTYFDFAPDRAAAVAALTG